MLQVKGKPGDVNQTSWHVYTEHLLNKAGRMPLRNRLAGVKSWEAHQARGCTGLEAGERQSIGRTGLQEREVFRS